MPAPSGNDPNTVNLAAYKGDIVPCPHCVTPESRLSGRTCTYCMDKRFLSKCTNCHATGSYDGKSVWDGGRSEHRSTCSPCGGKGFYPATEADYIRQRAQSGSAAAMASAPALANRPLPRSVQPMNNLEISRFSK